MKASTLQKKLIERFGLSHCRTSEAWDGSEGGLWLSGEQYAKDAYNAAQAEFEVYNAYGYEQDPEENIWIMGVYRPIAVMLENAGFYAEPYDSGTIIIYPCN